MRLKKLDVLIIKSFAGPFIVTFFVTIFILLMQFLFKYIDDLVGKGLEWYTIIQLLMYAASSLVPMALPLAILLSSIMTFGNLGEQYELVAIKSAGISLQRAMRPMMITVAVLGVSAFFFSNYVIPIANLKMGSLLYDVRQKKPGLIIKNGIFYGGLPGYSIRVGQKDEDGQTLHKLMIYDHSAGQGNNSVMLANEGKMYKSADDRFLILKLIDGVSYQETANKQNIVDRKNHVRLAFKEHEVKFDLSAFELNRTDENLFKGHYSMLNIRQLVHAEDSIGNLRQEKVRNFRQLMYGFLPLFDSTKRHTRNALPHTLNPNNSLITMLVPAEQRADIISRAMNNARTIKSYVETAKDEQKDNRQLIARHEVEYHRKFTLSVACLVLFFVGAPLGAIIRKGGLGMPIVLSVGFFIVFHFLSFTGEKFVREGISTGFQGMWLATGVLIPIGIFLTYKSTTDSNLFSLDWYQKTFAKFFKSISTKTKK